VYLVSTYLLTEITDDGKYKRGAVSTSILDV